MAQKKATGGIKSAPARRLTTPSPVKAIIELRIEKWDQGHHHGMLIVCRTCDVAVRQTSHLWYAATVARSNKHASGYGC
eukprot:356114-Chlamydomonas_euryale.AAC.11